MAKTRTSDPWKGWEPGGIEPAYRSTSEKKVAGGLTTLGVPFLYEAITIPFQPKPAKYKPDFVLPNGLIIEVKGYWEAEDRAKHLLVQQQHPELNGLIRFSFDRPNNKLHPKSETTYAAWADQHGFMWTKTSVGIPSEWLAEEPRGPFAQRKDH